MFGAANPIHCANKAPLSATVFSTSLALPLRPELAMPISWAIEAARERGEWVMATSQATSQYTPPPACGQASTSSTSTSGRRLSHAEGAGGGSVLTGGEAGGEDAAAGAVDSSPGRQLASSGGSVGSAVAGSQTNNAGASNSQQLTIQGAGGPFLIAIFTATVALVVNAIGRMLHANKKDGSRTGPAADVVTSPSRMSAIVEATDPIKASSSSQEARDTDHETSPDGDTSRCASSTAQQVEELHTSRPEAASVASVTNGTADRQPSALAPLPASDL